jgi:cytochrome P450
LKEALRIHPGVAFPLERYVPPEGAIICGYDLPGGTNVSLNPAVVQMDKGVYGSDADHFRPERWIEASPDRLRLMDRSHIAVGSRNL